MRVVERVLINAISRYLPGVDTDALRVNLLSQTATLSHVDLCHPSVSEAPTVLVCGLPFTVRPPSALVSLRVALPAGVLRVHATGLSISLALVPYVRAPRVPAVRHAQNRAKRAALVEGERQATGLFASIVNRLLPLLAQRLQFCVEDVRVVVDLPGNHTIEIRIAKAFTEAFQELDDDEHAARGRMPSETHDLSKDVTVRGVRVSLDGALTFSLPRMKFSLRDAAGQLSLNLLVDEAIRVALSECTAEQIVALRRELSLWEVASVYRRPAFSPCETPRAWWRYAVRVITRSGAGGRLDSDFGVSRLKRCVKYQKLHLERLKKGAAVSRRVLDSCLELEEVLDTETVLLLRASARRSVMSETATRFAAENWLGWMLVGSGDRPQDRSMAADVHTVVASVHEAHENSESLGSTIAGLGFASFAPVVDSADADSAAVAEWTQGTLTVDVSEVVVSCSTEEDDLRFDICLDRIHAGLNLDSALSELSAQCCIESLSLTDGTASFLMMLQKNMFLPALSGQSTGSNDVSGRASDELSMDASKPRDITSAFARQSVDVQAAVSFSVKFSSQEVASLSAAELSVAPVVLSVDVSRMSPVLSVLMRVVNGTEGVGDCVSARRNSLPVLPERETVNAMHLPFVLPSFTSEVERQRIAHVLSADVVVPRVGHAVARGPGLPSMMNEADWWSQLTLQINLEEVHLILSSGLVSREDAEHERNAILLSALDASVSWSPLSLDSTQRASASGSCSLRACVIANDLLDGGDGSSIAEYSEELPSDGNELRATLDKLRFLRVLRLDVPCVQVEGFRIVTTDEIQMDCSANHVSLRVCSYEVACLCRVLTGILDEFRGEASENPLPAQGDPSSWGGGVAYTRRAWLRYSNQGEYVLRTSLCWTLADRCAIRLPLLSVVGRKRPGTSSDSWKLVVQGILVKLRNNLATLSEVSVGDLRFNEEGGASRLVLSSRDTISSSALAVSVSSSDAQNGERNTGASSSPEVTTYVKVAHVEVFVTPRFVLDFAESLSGAFVPIIRLTSLESVSSAVLDYDIGGVPADDQSRSLSYLEVVLEYVDACLAVNGFKSLLNATGARLMFHGDDWDVRISQLSLRDMVAARNDLATVISAQNKLEDAVVSPSPEYCLQIRSSPSRVEVLLASLRVTILRAYVEQLMSSIRFLVSAISLGITTISGALSETQSHDGRNNVAAMEVASPAGSADGQNAEHASAPFGLIATNVFIVLPTGVDDPTLSGVDVEELVLRVAPVALTLSVGGMSVLTCAAARERGSRSALNAIGYWKTALSRLDLDIERVQGHGEQAMTDVDARGSRSFEEDAPRRWKEEWTVNLHRVVRCAVCREQVQILGKTLQMNLLKPVVAEVGCSAAEEVPAEAMPPVSEEPRRDENELVLEYARSVYRVTIPGIAIAVLRHSGSDSSREIPLARLELGEVQLSADRIARRQAQRQASIASVTRMSVCLTSLSLYDERSSTPEPFRLVLDAQMDEPIDSVSQSVHRGCVSFRLHQFFDSTQKMESNVTVECHGFRMIHCPSLLSDLLELVAVGGVQNPSQAEMESRASVSVEPEQVRDGAVAKISVNVHAPQLFLVEEALTSQPRGLEVGCDALKVSVIFDAGGDILHGSHVRVKDLDCVLRAAPDIDEMPEHHMSGPTGSDEARKQGSWPDILKHSPSRAGQSLDLIPGVSTVPEEQDLAEDERVIPSVLLAWAMDRNYSVPFARVRVVHVRFPNSASSSLIVTAPHVLVDGTVHDVASVALLLPRLVLVPDVAASADGASVPPVEVACSDVELIIRIPQHRLRDVHLRPGGDGSALLRSRIGVSVLTSRSGSLIDIEVVGRGVRAYDGQTGVWDRRSVIEPCSFFLSVQISPLPLICSVRGKNPLRFNLSPLIVKTLANLMQAMSSAFAEEERVADYSSPRVAPARGSAAQAVADTLRFECLWNQVELCLISDSMSVRLIVGGIEVQASLPLTEDAPGQLALRVGRLVVKNEALGRRNIENGRDWSYLLSSDADVSDAAEKRRILYLTEGVENLLLPFRVNRARTRQPQNAVEHGKSGSEKRLASSSSAPNGGTIWKESASKAAARTPALVAIVQLGHGGNDLEVRLGMTGLDIGVDLDVVLELMRWLNMVGASVAAAQDLYQRRTSVVHGKSLLGGSSVGGFEGNARGQHVAVGRRRTGRIVIEKLGMRLSARAARSVLAPSQMAPVRRALEIGIGSEAVSDITLWLPKLDLHVGFETAEDFLSAVASEYRRAALSGASILQLVRQAGALVALGRVGALTLLRRGGRALGAGPATGEAGDRWRQQRLRHEGLLELLDDDANFELERGQCIVERVSMMDAFGADTMARALHGRSWGTPGSPRAPLEGRPVSGLLGLPEAGPAGLASADVAQGFLIFQRLHETDGQLQASGESYRWFAQHAADSGLLVTDTQMLVVQFPECRVREPRISLARVSHYTVPRRGVARLVVHFAQQPGAALARARTRNAGSLMEAMGAAQPQVIACRDRATADALAKMLPSARSLTAHDLPFVRGA